MFAICLAFICAFTATKIGSSVPLFLKSDGMVLSSCTIFAFLCRDVVTSQGSALLDTVFSDHFPLMLFSWFKDFVHWFVGSGEGFIFYLVLPPVSICCLVRSIFMDILKHRDDSESWFTIFPHCLWCVVILSTIYVFFLFYSTDLIESLPFYTVFVLLIASLALEVFSILQSPITLLKLLLSRRNNQEVLVETITEVQNNSGNEETTSSFTSPVFDRTRIMTHTIDLGNIFKAEKNVFKNKKVV